MRFTCPTCSARYTIADDRVPAHKVLRFTCSKCNQAVRLRRKAGPAPGGGARRQASSPDGAAAAQRSAATTGAQHTDAGAHPARGGACDSAAGRKDSSHAPAPPAVTDAWFVLVNREQQGPLGSGKVREMLARGEIAPRTYVWCDGMSNWKRLQDVVFFSDAVAEATDASQKGAGGASPPRPDSSGGSSSGADSPSRGRGAAPAAVASERPADPGQVRQPAPGSVSDGVLREGGPDSTEPVSAGSVDPSASDEQLGVAASRSEWISESPPDDDYLSAPPGETTRVFMATAGLFKRRRRNRIAAVVGVVAVVLLGGVILLDLTGVIQLPGMGFVYDATGLVDPDRDRAIARVQKRLSDSSLDPKDRERLRAKLLGLGRERGRQKRAGRKGRGRRADASRAAQVVVTQGIEEPAAASQEQRALIANVFADERKTEKAVKVSEASQIRAPNLPDGLTQEAIFEVIEENKSSMSLCIAESRRKGERLDGRMEVELTIQATGTVARADVSSPRFRGSAIGSCTVRRARRWRFPRFNGEPVTVIFPYVLSTSF